MNEERTGNCLRQMEHIRGHLWHRKFVAANQVMVATLKLSKWWLHSTLNLMINDLYPSWYICNQLTCNIGMISKKKYCENISRTYKTELCPSYFPKNSKISINIVCLFKKINFFAHTWDHYLLSSIFLN